MTVITSDLQSWRCHHGLPYYRHWSLWPLYGPNSLLFLSCGLKSKLNPITHCKWTYHRSWAVTYKGWVVLAWAGPNIQKLKEAHFFHSIEIEVRYHKRVPLSEHQRPEEPENKKWRKSRQQWRPRGPLGFQAFLQGNPQKVRFLKPCTSFLWGFVCIFFFFPFGLGLCSRFCLFLLFLIPNCSHSFQIVNLDGVSWQ